MILEHPFAPSFSPCPMLFLPINNGFYPSKWWVDGCLHKAMPTATYRVIWFSVCYQIRQRTSTSGVSCRSASVSPPRGRSYHTAPHLQQEQFDRSVHFTLNLNHDTAMWDTVISFNFNLSRKLVFVGVYVCLCIFVTLCVCVSITV